MTTDTNGEHKADLAATGNDGKREIDTTSSKNDLVKAKLRRQ